MGGITEEMLKRRSEHNDGVLHTLEELVLQEEGLDRIDKSLGTLCPNLKHLYMPNNLIPRIENLHRLKDLRYLNLALNNITKIEGLEKCESLEKLDLTLNFVDIKELFSVSKLSCNVNLRELFLTGNPCQDLNGYRHFVIATLPSLKRLDGIEVKPSERIKAKQVFDLIVEEIKNPKAREIDPISTTNEAGEALREYTPETRLAEHAELEQMRQAEKKKEEDKLEKKVSEKAQKRTGFEPLPADGKIYQKNEGGWSFKLMESECKSKVFLDVPIGRYMDISLVEIDIQPLWVRVLVKGKLLQLSLPEEVNPDSSVAQRSTTTGNLLITMPKVSSNTKVTINKHNKSSIFYTELPKEKTKHNIQTQKKRDQNVEEKATQKVSQELVLSHQSMCIEEPLRKKSHQPEITSEANYDDLPDLE